MVLGMETHLGDITRVIQLSVAPVFLLTAISTLISAMNGRLARIVDRRRVLLGRKGKSEAPDESLSLTEELALLEERSRLVYYAIFSSVLSALLVCLVVAFAFIGALMTTDLARVVATFFVLSMAAMIVALGLFLREIYLAVRTGTHTNR